MTVWRAIPGFVGIYDASDAGEVRRVGRSRGTRLGVLKPYRRPDGYLYATLRRDGRSHTIGVNRLVCLAFHGEPPTSEHEAAHRNGQRGDNRASNLAWLSPVENMADQVAHGTRVAGERNGAAKLTASDVAEIRARLATGSATQTAIAAEFGVSQSHVSEIASGRKWRSLIPHSSKEAA